MVIIFRVSDGAGGDVVSEIERATCIRGSGALPPIEIVTPERLVSGLVNDLAVAGEVPLPRVLSSKTFDVMVVELTPRMAAPAPGVVAPTVRRTFMFSDF